MVRTLLACRHARRRYAWRGPGSWLTARRRGGRSATGCARRCGGERRRCDHRAHDSQRREQTGEVDTRTGAQRPRREERIDDQCSQPGCEDGWPFGARRRHRGHSNYRRDHDDNSASDESPFVVEPELPRCQFVQGTSFIALDGSGG